MEKRAFEPEINYWTTCAAMIEFINAWLKEHEWKMSPSRGYALLADIVGWMQSEGIQPTTKPAFDFVIDRLKARSAELTGSELDFALSMEMSRWRDREAPVFGDAHRQIGMIFDWFVPILVTLEALGASALAKSSRGGEDVSNAEAFEFVFMAADRLSKNERFQTRNAWGWPKTYPWADFIRDEMYAFKMKLAEIEPVIAPPGGSTAFSVGGM